MRKYLILILLTCLCLFCSCGAGHYFGRGEYQPDRYFNKPMTVESIDEDTAILITEHWNIRYLVDSEGLEVGETYYFMLSVFPCYNCREFRATIHNKFRLDQKNEYRKALHAQHLN